MIKSKKSIALLIAAIMLMSNFVGLLTNISLAIQSSVRVEICADSDGKITLSDGIMNDQNKLQRKSANVYSR